MANVSVVNKILFKAAKMFMTRKMKIALESFSGDGFLVKPTGIDKRASDGTPDVSIKPTSLSRYRNNRKNTDHLVLNVEVHVDMNSAVFDEDSPLGKELREYIKDMYQDRAASENAVVAHH